jgi:Beta-lactamase
MTKPITSVAAMMLIDTGKLSLSDLASKYILGFADVKVGVSSVAADGAPILNLVPLADRECIQQVEGPQAHRNPI